MQEKAQTCLIKVVYQIIDEGNDSITRKNIAKDRDFKILVDCRHPQTNSDKFTKETKPNYSAKNKQMFGIEYNNKSEVIIVKAAEKIKKIFRKYCGHKIFLQKVPREDSSTGTMRKYRQVLNTHLALSEYVSSIELAGILELELKSEVKVKNEDGDIVEVTMSLRSILMEIVSPSSNKPLFLMVAGTHNREFEEILPTYGKRI